MNLVIFLHDAFTVNGTLRMTGVAFVGPTGTQVVWAADTSSGSPTSTVNAAVRDAAIAAAAAAGFTVGPADQKTLIAGAVQV